MTLLQKFSCFNNNWN